MEISLENLYVDIGAQGLSPIIRIQILQIDHHYIF